MRQTINGADLRRMIISAAATSEIRKQKLNDLNVFPVPDGDTGTNMSMTINTAAADLRKAEDPTLEKAAAITASAMLRGARGNSGVILSLLLRGISKKLKGAQDCDGVLWAQALQEGVDAAYKAVMKPAEGTILTVFILPNNKNIIMAAQQVEGLTPKNVVVIPSKTVPQGITAMLSFNPEGTQEENVEALTEALGNVDTMQITYAARNSDFDGHDIHEGDYLAIYGSGLFGTNKDIKVLLRALAEKVAQEDKEYITIYYGEDIQEKHAQKAADLFQEICPNADVNLIRGGQPVYYYLISAE